jgi:Na+-translocating ferredoxin:NAD+ oxidoreductase RNF subunit RnfB
MVRLREMNQIYAELPHIDCGSCGRPSCKALAEDVVRGNGEATDCIFKLRERIYELAREVAELSSRPPHAFNRKR